MGTFSSKSEFLSSGTYRVEDKSGQASYVVSKKYKMIIPVNFSQFELDIVGKNVYLLSVTTAEEKLYLINKLQIQLDGSAISLTKKMEAYTLITALKEVNTNYIDVIFMKNENQDAINANVLKKILKQILQNINEFYGVAAAPFTSGVDEGKHCFVSLGADYKRLLEPFNGFIVALTYTPYQTIGLSNFCLTENAYKKITGETVKQTFIDVTPTLTGTGFMNIFPNTFYSYNMEKIFIESISAKAELDDALKTFENGITQKSKTITSIVPFFKMDKFGIKNINSKKDLDGNQYCGTNELKNIALDTDNFIITGIYKFADTENNPFTYLVYPTRDSDVFLVFTGYATSIQTSDVLNTFISSENKNKYITEQSINKVLSTGDWDVVERNIKDRVNRKSMDYMMGNIIVNGVIMNTDINELCIGSNFSYELYTVINNYFTGDTVNSDEVLSSIKLQISSTLENMKKNGIFSNETIMSTTVADVHGTITIEASAYDKDTNKTYQFNITL